jgi:peptidoglycan/LPS O-acetylase OafA/YrhL
MTQTAAGGYRVQTGQLDHGQKLQSIEAMRGLLALLVCCGHLGLNTFAERFGVKVEFRLAVDIFFILSGFVLTKSYYFGKRTFGRLVLARIARLYPLHALTLLMTLCIFLAASKPVDWAVALQHAALIHNIGLPPNRIDLNGPSWSISVEMALSLLFYWAIRRDRDSLVPPLIVLGIFFAYLGLDSNLDAAAENKFAIVNAGLLRGIAGFCLGSAACMITERYGSELRKYSWLALPLFLAIVPFFLIGNLTPQAGVFFELITFLFLIISTANDELSFLTFPPFVFLGTISYSVYLLHMPVSFAMEFSLPEEAVRGAGKLAQLAVILTAAALSHRFYEVPLQRFIMSIPSMARHRTQPRRQGVK